MAKLLIVDKERATRKSLGDLFEKENYHVITCESADACKTLIGKNPYDLIIYDADMPDVDGYSFINIVINRQLGTPVILFGANPTAEYVSKCLHAGVEYFFEKPFPLKELITEVRHILTNAPVELQKKEVKVKSKKESGAIPEITGNSRAILAIKEDIRRIAPRYNRVLITGDNGTGKELVARWLHELSNHKDAPFIAVNCAAISSELIEATLFGHEKGSFTSADKQCIGKFELANGGTLFLDEIGDMSLVAQSKVLRALQENKICRVGGMKDIDVDVKVVAATNKNLREEILRGNFREDLYYRLNVIPIHVPPLVERRDDIPLLVEQFNRLLSNKWQTEMVEVTPEAMYMLQQREWPGNIRQLQNIVERLMLFSDDRKITPSLVERHCCNEW
ncbi:MAG: sigma-54 dependent transcriptional regulator [Rikenellaceae bacterium]